MARSRRPSGSATSGCWHDLLGLVRRQHVLGQAVFQARQDQLRCRIVQDVVLPRHPAEPALDGAQARVLRAEAERLAVLLAVVIEPALIAFQDRPRDFGWLFEAALLAPVEEVADEARRVFDGVAGEVLRLHPHQVLGEQLRACGLSGAVRFALPPYGTVRLLRRHPRLGISAFSRNPVKAVWQARRYWRFAATTPRHPPDLGPTWPRLLLFQAPTSFRRIVISSTSISPGRNGLPPSPWPSNSSS